MAQVVTLVRSLRKCTDTVVFFHSRHLMRRLLGDRFWSLSLESRCVALLAPVYSPGVRAAHVMIKDVQDSATEFADYQVRVCVCGNSRQGAPRQHNYQPSSMYVGNDGRRELCKAAEAPRLQLCLA